MAPTRAVKDRKTSAAPDVLPPDETVGAAAATVMVSAADDTESPIPVSIVAALVESPVSAPVAGGAVVPSAATTIGNSARNVARLPPAAIVAATAVAFVLTVSWIVVFAASSTVESAVMDVTVPPASATGAIMISGVSEIVTS